MKNGTLYGIGVGAGDPEWLTVKAARLLGATRHICVPRSRVAAESVALDIARRHLRADAVIHEITFPMTSDAAVLRQSWHAAAEQVNAILAGGEDCCFLTLGDAMLYSTWIYLLRELRAIDANASVEIVPGITAFSA
ncbi:MAG: precorrin-2 C(20)-methyltransferase, partial [Phycisphaerae bacterium]|nr:precorrin-2 C(20)-methyltransferase [Phycisphaerae bacterium]